MIENPPMCSFPSVNGPSVVSTFAVLHAEHGCGVRRVESPGKHPHAGGLHLVPDRIDVAHDLFQDRGGRRLAVGLIHAEQILLHG